jgi:hypothetical protein
VGGMGASGDGPHWMKGTGRPHIHFDDVADGGRWLGGMFST